MSLNFFIRSLVILLAILFIHVPNYAMGQEPTVMTLNLFLGAEIQSLAESPDFNAFIEGVEDVLNQVAANDFTERAEALAALVVENNPHLIGLQEVYDFTSLNPELDGSPPFLDYLHELKGALSEQGACYEDVATVANLNFGPIPLPSYGYVSINDRDVILARCDVDTEVVDLTGYPLCRPSVDGCNFTNVAETDLPDPLGAIAFERGYVAVNTLYGLFINTHLEVRFPIPDNPFSAFFQSAQVAELIGLLNTIDHQNKPVIVVGDINSSPEHLDIGPIVTPYNQFVAAEYVDAWTLRHGKPKGFTCCYDEDLTVQADLYERIDMIFTSIEPSGVKANVVGNDEADQTPSGLWPSDHTGVVAQIEF